MTEIQGFSRLKGFFTSNINYKDYNRIVSSAKNKVIGNLPGEIINAATKNFPTNKAEEIKNIQNGLSESAKILKEYNKVLIEKSKNAPITDDLLEDFIRTHVSTSFNNMLRKISSVRRHDTSRTTDKKLISVLQNAQIPLLKSMSKILPKNAKVEISPIGEGGFGNVFKIAFLDKNDKDIFNPLAIKVYKGHTFDIKLDDTQLYTTRVLFKIKSMDEAKLLEKIKKIQVQEKAEFPHCECQVPELVMKNLKDLSFETLGQMLDPKLAVFLDKTHGACPEANSIFKYKKSAGHPLSKTRMNNAYMFNLEDNYSIAPFADRKYLPKLTSKSSLDSYGFDCKDKNPDNFVAGRFIDTGGFAIARGQDELMDSTTLKYYKKIRNRQNAKEQLELIERYSKLAQNPKTPLRNKIATGVSLAESDINAYKSLYQD